MPTDTTTSAMGEYVLVPREPTPEMLAAADSASPRFEAERDGSRLMGVDGALDCWKAMIAAAPTPPGGKEGGSEPGDLTASERTGTPAPPSIRPYWVSWLGENGVFELHSPWWISGYSPDDETVFCAAVMADSTEGAKGVIQAALSAPSPVSVEEIDPRDLFAAIEAGCFVTDDNRHALVIDPAKVKSTLLARVATNQGASK